MSKKITLCVVGVGQIFEQYHLPSINNTGKYEIVALVDRDEKRLKYLGSKLGVKTYTDIKAVQQADVCFVATPPNVRTQVIAPAIQKGMDIVCEKPFTYTSKEAKELIALADKHGKRIFVTQTRRYFTNMILLREMITNDFANIQKLRIVEGGLYGWKSVGTERAAVIKNDTGVLHDTGSHLIDSLIFMLGDKLKSLSTDNIVKSLFDYEYGSNNFKAVLELDIDGKKIPTTVLISRDQNLLDYVEVQTNSGKLKTRSLFSDTVEVHTPQKNKIQITSDNITYPGSMDEVFGRVWDHIAEELVHHTTPNNFSFNVKTVLPAIELIDYLAEKKTVKEFNDFYEGQWN